ncbi:hypothetical protein NC651_000047 [Populus alba x Populus x berolinensis]|nr:hypothetical protein NC651_000047 [Populus alba x Populus x berolinensis]
MGINAVGSRRKLLLLRDSRSLERGLTLTFAIFLGDATEFWITCVRRSWICSGFSNKLPPCYALDALGRIYLGGNGVEDCLIREVVLRLSDHPLAYFKSFLSSQPLMPGIWIRKPGASSECWRITVLN